MTRSSHRPRVRSVAALVVAPIALLAFVGGASATTVAVTVDPTGSVSLGVPTVTGTVTCDAPTTLTLSGSLTQWTRHNRHFEFADFSATVACSTTPAAWTSAPLVDQSGRFLRGQVDVTTSVVFADGTYGGYFTGQATLR